MRKLLSVSLVVLIAFAVSGGAISKNGLNVSRVIAMEQKSTDANMLKPLASVFPAIAPNDPNFKYQWNLDDYGKVYTSGTGKNKKTVYSNHGIQAMKAWKLGYSGNGVKIAIIGYGVAYKDFDKNGDGINEYKKAPDFKNTKFDTTNAINLTNYSGDITADLAAGTIDAAKFSKDPIDATVGTSIAAVMSASTNDSYGCAGIAYNATILPIKAWSITGETNTGLTGWTCLSYAIGYAVTKGANIIYIHNMWGLYNQGVQDALTAAYNANVVIVCSNWPNEPDNPTWIYPAAYDECISVGATNFNGVPTSNSAQGNWLDLVAPAGNINEDLNNDGFNDGILSQVINANLTFGFSRSDVHSRAGAQVAAIIALMLEKHPGLTPAEVKSILIANAKQDTGITYPNNTYGNGLVDAYGVVYNTPNP